MGNQATLLVPPPLFTCKDDSRSGCKNRRTTIDGVNGDIIVRVVMDRRYHKRDFSDFADEPLKESFFFTDEGGKPYRNNSTLSKVGHFSATADNFF